MADAGYSELYSKIVLQNCTPYFFVLHLFQVEQNMEYILFICLTKNVLA